MTDIASPATYTSRNSINNYSKQISLNKSSKYAYNPISSEIKDIDTIDNIIMNHSDARNVPSQSRLTNSPPTDVPQHDSPQENSKTNILVTSSIRNHEYAPRMNSYVDEQTEMLNNTRISTDCNSRKNLFSDGSSIVSHNVMTIANDDFKTNDIGEGVLMSDNDLIIMLQKPPKSIPQLRTKSSFQSFFRGMDMKRMTKLLETAYSNISSKFDILLYPFVV